MTSHPIQFDDVSFTYALDQPEVLKDLNVSIPPGVTSLVGQNGTGKSTFLLLASGRILPQQGTVFLQGEDTQTLDESERSRLCSLVFQNMEFETEEPLGELLQFVLKSGFLEAKDTAFLDELVQVFELESHWTKKTQHLSKGEMQRAIMAFALLYGSQVTVMDEPVFALEDHQKIRALDYLTAYSRRSGRSFVYSAHELDLTRRFSDRVLLFYKDSPPVVGLADEMLTRDKLEAAYQVPFALLHKKEELFRQALLKLPGSGLPPS